MMDDYGNTLIHFTSQSAGSFRDDVAAWDRLMEAMKNMQFFYGQVA
jgi:hypothetical protein